MARPLSDDLRERLVRAVEQGSSAAAAARRFDVSASAADKLMRRVHETGSRAPSRIGGYRRPMLEGHEAVLRELTTARPGITLAELRAALHERGVMVRALSTIWSTLRRLGLSHKKSVRAAEQDRPDVALRRLFWRVWQRSIDAERFVFLDETSVTTNMLGRYGWGPKDRRLVEAAPFGTRCTATLLAGLRSNAVVAPLVLDGAMTGDAFVAYLRQSLAPTLSPGDIVVMDNVPAHKVDGVEDAVAATGASILYLPPYSPDLNPIEQVFAKIKTLLRKAATRTREALDAAIATLLGSVGPDECRNYLTNSGYTCE